MSKRLIALFFLSFAVILFMLSFVSAIVLNDLTKTSFSYPSPYVVDESANYAIIYGTNEDSALVLVQAGNIREDLNSLLENTGETLIMDSELDSVKDKNLIIVGTCGNSVISSLMQGDCSSSFIQSYGSPYTSGKTILLIVGPDAESIVELVSDFLENPGIKEPVQEPDCTSHANYSCYDGDLYWYDSCGNKEDKKQDCENGCQGLTCITLQNNCTSHASHACYSGHVYWYDSCGIKEDKKEYCENGCENGVCGEVSETCQNHYKHKCAEDGNVYWYDSCGNKQEKKYSCEYGCENNKCKEKEKNQIVFAITPKAYKGTEITSVEKGNEICKNAFGEEWKWFEWHSDIEGNSYGWTTKAELKSGQELVNDKNLFTWIWIDDQSAECFNTGNKYGLTYNIFKSASNPELHVGTCVNNGYLELSNEQEYNLHYYSGDKKCNPYSGDTPCVYEKNLLCYNYEADSEIACSQPVCENGKKYKVGTDKNGCPVYKCEEYQRQKGYRYAYWECYNEKAKKLGSTNSCKTSEIWKSYAINDCAGECYDDKSKCGVNSFGVVEECYINENNECEAYCTLECPYGYVEGSCNCECLEPPMPSCPEPPRCENGKVAVGSISSDMECPTYYCDEISEPEKEQEELCKISDGEWRTFNNGCADSCEAARATEPIACTEAFVDSCDCGPDKCWNGEKCEPNEIPEIKSCTDSCAMNGKCYPFGYRKSRNFCSEEGVFVEQFQKYSECENHFECNSNVCIEGECIGKGVIQAIIDFINKFFGGSSNSELKEAVVEAQ